MKFDISAARSSGYSDDEIASYLAQEKKFDLAAALESGYTPAEVVGFLSEAPKVTDTGDESARLAARYPAPEQPGIIDHFTKTMGDMGGVAARMLPGTGLGIAGAAVESMASPKASKPSPVKAAKPVRAEPTPYKSRVEALDDAVNLVEEGVPLDTVAEAFGKGGIKFDDIVAHGQKRGSDYFKQQAAAPVDPEVANLARRYPAPVTGEIKAWQPSTTEELANLVTRGVETGGRTIDVLRNRTGLGMSDEFLADRIAKRQRKIEGAAPGEGLQRGMQEIADAGDKGLLEAAGAIATNPKAGLAMIAESVIATAPAAAASVGGFMLNPVAGVGAGFTAGAAMEFGATVVDTMIDAGMNPSDPVSVAKALADPELMKLAQDRGMTRGLTVGAFSALTSGVASQFAKPILAAASRGQIGRAAGLAAGAGGIGIVGDSIGEAAAQTAVGDKLNYSDILIEGLAGGPGTVGDVAGSTAAAYRNDPNRQIAREIDAAVAGGQFSDADPIARARLDPNAYDPALIDPAQTARQRGDVGPSAPAGLINSTISFTPTDSPTAQAGLVPIVIPVSAGAPDVSTGLGAGPAPSVGGEQPGDLSGAGMGTEGPSGVVGQPGAGVDAGLATLAGQAAAVPSGAGQRPAGLSRPLERATDTDLLARAEASLVAPGNNNADVQPVTIWTGRAGDGYATQDAAQAGLATRMKREPELRWEVEQMPSGKFRLAGYEQNVQVPAETSSDATATGGLPAAGATAPAMEAAGVGQPITAPSGKPFSTPQTAAVYAQQNGITGYSTVRMGAGWAIAPAKQAGANQAVESAQAPAQAIEPAQVGIKGKSGRTYRDTRGTGVRLHGTSKPLPESGPTNDGVYSGSVKNIYGQGFYTTNAADIADGYTLKGKGAAPVAYEIQERGNVNLYDMDQPMSDEVRQIARTALGDLYSETNTDTGEPITTLSQVFDEARADSSYQGVSADEVQDSFMSVRDGLETLGYRGFKHIGGRKTGRSAHDVRIYWFPENDITVTSADMSQYEAGGSSTKAKTNGTQTAQAVQGQAQGQAAVAEAATPAAPAAPTRLGIDNVPFSDGGKPFKTKLAASKAKKLQPTMRVVKVDGGFALADKTPAQLAAAQKAAKRLRTFSAGTQGKPMSAHEFVVSKGGMNASTRSELGIEGNPRVGNRSLYGGKGMGLTLSEAAELLKEAGYITDESENSSSDIIRRSLTDPQYTPEGWEQVAESEREAQFEDYVAAQEEAAQADDYDPFSNLSDLGYEEADVANSKYVAADQALQNEVNALMAQMDALGIYPDEVLDPIIAANPDAKQDRFNELAKAALVKAIDQATQSRSDQDRGSDNAEPGQARGQDGAQEEGLTAYTPQEIEVLEQARAKRDADQSKADAAADRQDAADRQRAEVRNRSEAAADTFELGGNAEDNLSGQGGLKFSRAKLGAKQYPLAPRSEWYGEGTFQQQGGRMVSVSPDEYLAAVRPLVMDEESRENIDLLKEHIQSGKTLDPLLIRANGKEDGRHRAHAAKELGIAQVPVISYGEQFVDAPAYPGDGILRSKAKAEDPRDLIITHNLTAENLLHAVRMGGIAVPSLAVTKKSSALNGFGEITLIGDKAMADPKGYAGTKVFGADIYSPRYPKITYELTPAKLKALKADFAAGENATGAKIQLDEVASRGGDELVNSAAVMWQFLTDRGLQPDVKMKDGVAPERVQRMKEFGFEKFFGNTDHQSLMRDEEFQRLAISELNDAYVAAEMPKRVVDFEDAKVNDPSRLMALSRDIAYEMKKIGQPSEPDGYRTRDALRTQIRGDLDVEFKAYVAKKFEALGAKEKIFQGFTNSGNRKYTPHTLENVVKILKKELRGGEGFNYGVGSLRAKFTPQFKSVDEIRKNKDRLINKASFEAVKTEVDNELIGISDALNLSLDQTIEVLEDAPKVGVSRAIERAFKDYLGGQAEVSDATKERVAKYLTRLRNLPTEYFEAKILRPVSLSEFKSAVVPEGVSEKALKALRDAGVTNIRTYNKGDDASRAAAVEAAAIEFADDVLFSKTKTSPRTPITAIRAAINSAYGTLLTQLEGKGLVTMTQTQEQAVEAAAQARAAKTGGDVEAIKRSLMAAVTDGQGTELDVKYSKDGQTQGFFDPQTQQSFLIADNLTADTAPGVLMHEVGIHMAGENQPLFDRAAELVKDGDGKFFDRVRDRMQEAGETSSEEAAAYIAEEYENQRLAAPASVRQWVADFIANARAWLNGKGVLVAASKLTPADIAAVARANARSMARGEAEGGVKFSKAVRAVTDTAAFKRWFGDSKVVDAQGQPLVVYHGTKGDFNKFSLKKFGQTDGGWAGEGFYFAPNPDEASIYAASMSSPYGNSTGANVMPVFLAAKNPLEWRIGRDKDRRIQNKRNELGAKEFAAWVQSEGYDAIHITSPDIGKVKGEDQWVVFRPEQIKSATGNRGTFDPDDSDIRFSRRAVKREKLIGTRFEIPALTSTDAGRRLLQDDALRMKRVLEAVKKQGGTVGEAQNFYEANTLMPGRIQAAMDDFRDNVMTPLIDKAVAADIDLDELALYAYAKHAKERNAYIASINQRMPDGGSGMKNADADQILADVAASPKADAMEDLHKDLMAITATTRQLMVNEGLITQDQFDAMANAYDNYIPLRGLESVDENTGAARPGVGRGINVRGNETIRALGRRSRASDLIENAIRDYQRVITRVEKNDVGKVLLDFVLSNPDADLWGVDIERTNAGFDKKRGVVQYTKVVEKGEDTIGVKVGGKQVYIKLADQDLTRALRQAWKDETSGLERVTLAATGWWNNWLRNVYTRYNPAFAVINIPRDALWSGTTAALADLGPKGLARYTAAYGKALMASGRRELNVAGNTSIFGNPAMDRMFEEFRAAGGITGGFYMRGLDEITDDLRNDMLQAGAKAKNPWEAVKAAPPYKLARGTLKALEFMGSASENATRFALYVAAREGGKTPQQAALLAKNGTTNFNRKGEWGGALNNLYLFFNAAVQGTAQLAYVLKSRNVQAAMAGVAGVGAMLALYGAAAGGEDDDGEAYWDKVPSYVKERNLVIMLPPGGPLLDGMERVGKRGRYITVPVQYGFNIFPNAGYMVADVFRNQQDPRRGVKPVKAALHMASVTLGSINPFGGAVDLSDGVQVLLAAMPTLADLPIQLITERGTFGTPSAPERSSWDMRPDSERMFTSQMGTVPEKIAKALNEMGGGNEAKPGEILGVETSVTPGTIQTLISATGSGLGTFMEQVATSVMAMSGSDKELKAAKTPFLNKFYGEVDEGVNIRGAGDRMREVRKEVSELESQFKLGLDPKIGTDEQRMLALADAGQQYQDATSKMRKDEIAIIKSDMPEPQKKLLRQQIQVERDKLATVVNRIYLDSLKQK